MTLKQVGKFAQLLLIETESDRYEVEPDFVNNGYNIYLHKDVFCYSTYINYKTDYQLAYHCKDYIVKNFEKKYREFILTRVEDPFDDWFN